MAKKFLDRLGDAFEEDVLVDLIPQKRPTAPSRKKHFLGNIEENIPSPKKKSAPSRSSSSGKRKSFLDTIEEALDSNAFDEVIPIAPKWTRNPNPAQMEMPQIESPFSTMITNEALERAREIAIAKGIRIKDVINIALKMYIEKEGK
ncbi:MAG: hypothetical protein SF052_05440 [Bacteroidia bacterium]|nr:hypothetical protein [Bacteroidia bacterium]